VSAPAVSLSGVPSGEDERRRHERLFLWGLAAVGVVMLVAAAARVQANPLLALATASLVVVAWQRYLLAWQTLLGYVLVVILFVPIRRFVVNSGLPIQLEPYRILVAVVLLVWLAALLVDPKVRWRRTGAEGPLVLYLVAIAGSLALNLPRVVGQGLTPEVVKKLWLFASFLLIIFFVASALRTRRDVDRTLMLIVGGGAIVALFSIIEWRTHFNPFNHIDRIVPIFRLDPTALDTLSRGTAVRTTASAEHPIALGAMLVMLLPLAIYLFRRRGERIWLVAAATLTMGALATGSRTAAVMLLVELLIFFWLKRQETIRLLPLLLPLAVVVQVAMPGTLGTFRAILFPENGLVAEQSYAQGTGAGRVADLGPSLSEWSRTPIFGQGFGTRLSSPNDKLQNARILDDEWLGQLLELGAVGFLALIWLYVSIVRRLGRLAKRDSSADGWLAAALAAAIGSYALGMLTYDAFSFTQVTFLAFVLIGISGVAVHLHKERSAAVPAAA